MNQQARPLKAPGRCQRTTMADDAAFAAAMATAKT
jgi:hypothetical protein